MNRHPLLVNNPHDLVPFLELQLYVDKQVPNLTSFTSLRLFATHLPFSSLLESVTCSASKLDYLCRNPMDTFVSLHHIANKIRPPSFGPNILEDVFDMFCRGVCLCRPFWDHVLGYWKESLEKPQKEITHSTSIVQKSKTIFHIASTLRRLYSFHRCIVASSHRLIIFSVIPTPRRLSSFHRHIVSSSSSSFMHPENCIRSFVASSLRLNIFVVEMGKKYVAQKKTTKRKRDEYHVKKETPQTNTCTNVDMRHVNYRSNMTELVKLMKTTKFTKAQLRCLQQTPFWNLFNALRNNQIDLDKCMKYDDVVVHVLQMYQASKDAFYIGEKKMNIYNSDIKLIFGVDCGSKLMDISYGAKPKTGIVNKRCKNVSRLTSKWIRTLLTESLKGKKKDDNEEVARLVCIPNAFPRCVKWDLTALQKKMKTTSLADLGFNEVEPEIYEPARTSPNFSDIKGEQHNGSNSHFSGDGVELKDSNEDIHIPFSSQHYDRAIVIPNTNQPDIIDVLVQENQKAWGVIRQWEAKYKHLQFSWELRARLIAALEHKLFNQSSPSNMNIEIKKCMEQKDKEIKHLTQLVIDLECDKTILQDLYDD
ncbi:hypothetical protein TEA_023199 [Camellia sinensis var. sinensis]|uniref:Sulfotransferase n=1 Tax=Camellia sinensis var. sinensis TaxID=542762 RepID=A0A4S4EYF2_CAMSN|nr:hypothetical protein TEA_023199 [Camellia sinensis var. sinensis]